MVGDFYTLPLHMEPVDTFILNSTQRKSLLWLRFVFDSYLFIYLLLFLYSRERRIDGCFYLIKCN